MSKADEIEIPRGTQRRIWHSELMVPCRLPRVKNPPSAASAHARETDLCLIAAPKRIGAWAFERTAAIAAFGKSRRAYLDRSVVPRLLRSPLPHHETPS